MISLATSLPEAFGAEGWRAGLIDRALARAFTAPPEKPIWEWADSTVWLQNEDAAEPGPYRSAKTPWTRRLQQLIRDPRMWFYDFTAERWIRIPVTEINIQKSSQSGITEACLNGIRWRASYRPCNVIYAIDSAEEAKKIARRLLRSFRFLDPGIFTGDPDDIKTLEFLLRGMELLFYGSFSEGKFANKQAPLVIADEVEEHGSNQLANLGSRKKTATGGLQINLSKPKHENGPINKGLKRGNQEQFHIECPHCHLLQPLTMFHEERESPFSDEWDDIRDEQTAELIARLPRPLPLGQTRTVRTGRLVFTHCKNLLGEWDRLRILRETWFECAGCQGRIHEHEKQSLSESAQWIPTALGTPGIVSEQINDLLSTDEGSTWGRIVLEYLDAKNEGRRALQGFYNHRLGIAWRDTASKTDIQIIRSNIAGREGDQCPPYIRGEIPFIPAGLLLGSDVGGNYAKWAIGAVMPNKRDIAIIDWGEEIDPGSVAHIFQSLRIRCTANDKSYALTGGFIDAKHRKTDVYRACMAIPGRRLMPCAGLGGSAARNVKLFAESPVSTFPMRGLSFNDREAKDEFYIERLRKRHRRVFFPRNIEDDPEFVAELCAEELIEDKHGRIVWNPYPPPNHYGDCCKLAVIGLSYLTRRIAVRPNVRVCDSAGEEPRA